MAGVSFMLTCNWIPFVLFFTYILSLGGWQYEIYKILPNACRQDQLVEFIFIKKYCLFEKFLFKSKLLYSDVLSEAVA